MSIKIIITPEQCKAARDLLTWKQIDLSEKSEISPSTIADFERGSRELTGRTLKELKRTLEDAGIEFINDDEGLGVKLLQNKQK
ncbi:MAG: helix-turn-helix transcriptional regulator [Pseudomonadota bacterium]